MPEVTRLLSQDHRKVEQLFEQFEATQDQAIAIEICQELTIHTQLEEQILYPRLERVDRDLEQEAEREHAQAKQLIARVRGMGRGDPALVDTMAELKGAIEHHVSEEENEAWPKLRDALSTDELETLGARVEEQKARLLGTPTTTTTTTPATTTTTTASTTKGPLIDLTKEELYEKAKQAEIPGRSSMTKAELADALQRRS